MRFALGKRDTRNLPRCKNALRGSARPPDPQGPGASPPGEPGTGRCPGRGERPVPGAQRGRAPGAGTQPGTGISVLGAATGPGIPAPICFWFLPTAPEPPPAPPPGAANWVHVAADGESIKTIFFFHPSRETWTTRFLSQKGALGQNSIRVEWLRHKGYTSPSSSTLVPQGWVGRVARAMGQKGCWHCLAWDAITPHPPPRERVTLCLCTPPPRLPSSCPRSIHPPRKQARCRGGRSGTRYTPAGCCTTTLPVLRTTAPRLRLELGGCGAFGGNHLHEEGKTIPG